MKLGEKLKAEAPVESPPEPVIFSCHPIVKFRIGKFKFEKSQLVFADDAAAEEFDKMLAEMPPHVRAKVRRIDRKSADSIAKQFMRSGRVRGVDTAGLPAENGGDARGLTIDTPDAPVAEPAEPADEPATGE